MTTQQLQHLFSSVKQDWKTPEIYIEAARRVMGRINLDPASDYDTNKWIKANWIFTKEDDGLSKEWHGNIWLNPPFNQSNKWVEKLLHEHRIGHTEQAILLVKFVPSYKWFKQLVHLPMVITDHRVSFWQAYNQPGTSKMDTSIAFVYLGDRVHDFEREFIKFGYAIDLRKRLQS